MERFEPERWRSSSKDARYVYTKDLQQRRILEELTREEAIALLGAPDYQAADGTYVTYTVRTRQANDFSMNAIYLLHVQFNKDGRVQDVFVRAD